MLVKVHNGNAGMPREKSNHSTGKVLMRLLTKAGNLSMVCIPTIRPAPKCPQRQSQTEHFSSRKHVMFGLGGRSSRIWVGHGITFVFLHSLAHQNLPGIEKLGAFLANSSRILILYSDCLFQKLWTVDSLCCF